MPTSKPRITITLPDHHHEVLSRLSAVGGDSMSQIVAGLIDLAVPSLERVVLVLERARDAPEEARSGLRSAIERAERDLIPLAQAVSGQADMFLADAERRVAPSPASETDAEQPARAPAVRSPAGTRRKGRGGGTDPRLVTRGSGCG